MGGTGFGGKYLDVCFGLLKNVIFILFDLEYIFSPVIHLKIDDIMLLIIISYGQKASANFTERRFYLWSGTFFCYMPV